MQDMAWIGLVFLFLQLLLASCSEAAFSVSLELQGDCSAQLTLICRHSDNVMAPLWIHNGTTEDDGVTLVTAFPGAKYTVLTRTEHTTTITGVESAQALDGYLIQCAYTRLSNVIKSNAVKFSFIPPDYRPALSLTSKTSDFSERLSTFTYSYQDSCNLYPRCTSYFSVDYAAFPQSAVNISPSGCSVEYTIHNLMRCVSYRSTATALLNDQMGYPVVMGSPVMLEVIFSGPGQFTITSVSIGANRDFIDVTYMENEPDCPDYPTERYTVDVDGVQVADLTADAVQSLAVNHTNGLVTLFLPLSKPLPEDAETLNMTKYNTVTTTRIDDMGNIADEMVTWWTSAEFVLRESPPGGELKETTTPDPPPVVTAVGVPAGILVLLAVVVGVIAVIVFIKRRNKMKKACNRCLQPFIWCLQPCIWCLQPCIWCLHACIWCLPLLMLTVRKKKNASEASNKTK